MSAQLAHISMMARRAAQAQDWGTVGACAQQILEHDPDNAEGHFLKGLFHKVSRQPNFAAEAFAHALEVDPSRYDAAVELANQYSVQRKNGEAAELLDRYVGSLDNSPMYLDLAGTVYSDIGLPERAFPLYQKATTLQPGVDLFQANLATCSVYLGKIDEAKATYQVLLDRFPGHRRNHYQLSRLGRAKDRTHVEQMKAILANGNETPDKNIFMYYAIAKELEDLGEWDEAFSYYKQGGDAVTSVARYDVEEDTQLVDTIIKTCTTDWLVDRPGTQRFERTPIFIVGLPRTGTTLTERIISSHSQVVSLGETQFLQMVLRRQSGVATIENFNTEIVTAVAQTEIEDIARGYLDSVAYRLGEEPFFIDKLPLNFLFVGFIAKAWPEARIVHLRRSPMDACFSMYKQIFTWAYKFSYSLDMLADYYIAYDRLTKHWQELLGERLIEVRYEELVDNQDAQTRSLLKKLALPFEEACLNFDENSAPSTTASSVQIREKVYTGSINKWYRFREHLEPLRRRLSDAGIAVD